MKRGYKSTLVFLVILASSVQVSALTVVPDANFRAKLTASYGITFDGSNTILNPGAAADLLTLDVSSSLITDLTGIEAFTSLTSLNCNTNHLSGINLSANTALTDLYLNSCQLTSLDISANTNLVNVDFNYNQLTSLDVSSNTALQHLFVAYNSLSILDITANTVLTFITTKGNPSGLLMYVWELPFPTPGITLFDTNPASTKLLGTLPVELVSFTGHLQEGNILLSWETKTETNNYGWEIEKSKRSEDPELASGTEAGTFPIESGLSDRNAEWETIGFVAGNGTTTESQVYKFSSLVTSPSSPAVYRLKQLDLDGTVSYSQLLVIEGSPVQFELIGNYPNPFNPSTKISYSVPKAGNVTLKVYDAQGREVETLVNSNRESGTYVAEFNGSGKTSGLYFVRMTAGGFTSTRKMMMVK